ncbi:phosphotransferase [Photobacterium sp. 1_MG-2023]|uniref:phosphotransferase n=1 Tax=Photobacterium sp. 1_MG-2023 TaxID=3062646 RepID=UPI0026E31310|nr:phosphotransferase [Photobacterium sp. 1_MG-2023]MDO6707329.1 phosphotransferase [Photobacterium sp. 1_MG-2023]
MSSGHSSAGAFPFSRLAGYEVRCARPLSGGLSNRCWHLTLNTSPHFDAPETTLVEAVWRPDSPISRAFGVHRHHEFQLLAAIQSSGIAPAALAENRHGILVEWIEGQVLTQPPSTEELMQLLYRVHCLSAPQWALDVRQKAGHYLASIQPSDKSAPLNSVCQRFFQQIPDRLFPQTCCHHDLGFYNLIRRPDSQLAVIDWEYAAAGDPMLDLALTIQANGLDAKAAAKIYAQLAGYDELTVSNAVQQWLPWCDFLAMLWYYAGAHLWQDESYRLEAHAYLAKLIA